MKLLLILQFIPLLVLSQIQDYVSDLDLGNIYNNQISTDFVVLGIHGNQLYEHYEFCSISNLSLYDYDTIWNIYHLGEDTENQKYPRKAFLDKQNFHLMDFEEWCPEKGDFLIGPYKPYYNGYDYYLGNGFAFNNMNEILDYNSDGFLDLRIKYTKLDYEASYHLSRSISVSIFNEYQKKIKSGDLDKDVDFNEYERQVMKSNHNYGNYGYGYITKYSEGGLIYFFIEK